MKSVSQTPKRTVLYARVSTEEQAKEGYSLGEQVRRLSEYAHGGGLVVVRDPVVDEGASGRSMDRPGLNLVRSLAKAAEFDVLLVSNWDRLFRNAGYQAAFLSEMSALGVSVTSLDGQDNATAEGKLFNQIQAGFAEYFRDRIITNMRYGKQGRARTGKVLPSRSAPLGFEYDAEIGNYRVLPEKMVIARRIFEEIASGKSMRAVKLAFEAEGIKPPGYDRAVLSGEKPPEHWSITTIRRIVQNDVYLGTYWFNRSRVEKNPDSNGRRYTKTANPKEDWIAVPVPPSDIEPELIEAARRAISKNVRPSNAGRRPWVLKGLLRCECGSRMTAFTIQTKGKKRRFYYVCARHRRERDCPFVRYHPAEELEHRVERVALDLIRRPEIMLERVQREIEEMRSAVEDSATQLAAWETQAAKIQGRRTRFQEMAASGLMTLDELRPKLEDLERDAAAARAEIDRLKEPEKAIAGFEEIPARIEDYIAELPEIVESDPERKAAHLAEIYSKLAFDVLARKDGSMVITGAFGERDLSPDDPGPFIGIRATRCLDSEAYTWTELPLPDDPFWDTWNEGDPVIKVCKTWRTSW